MSTHYTRPDCAEYRAPFPTVSPDVTRYRSAAEICAAINAAAADAPEFSDACYAPGAADWHGPTRGASFAHFLYCIDGARGSYSVSNTRENLLTLARKVNTIRAAFDGKPRRAPAAKRAPTSAPHVAARALMADGNARDAIQLAENSGAVFFGAAAIGAPGVPYMGCETVEFFGHSFTIGRAIKTGRFLVLHTSTALSVSGSAHRDGFKTHSAALDWIETESACDAWREKFLTALHGRSAFDQTAARARYFEDETAPVETIEPAPVESAPAETAPDAPIDPAAVDRMAAAKFARQSAILEKLIRCDGQVMTRRAFLHSKIRDGLRLTVEQHDRIAPMSRMATFRASNEEQRAHDRRILAAGKKDVFFIGGFEITKTEFDYAAEILASMAPAADPAPVPGDSDPVPVNSADVDAVEVARLVAKFRQFADERRRTGDTLAAAIRVESAEARYRADSLTAPNAFRDAPGAGHEAAKAHDTRRAAEYRAAAAELDRLADAMPADDAAPVATHSATHPDVFNVFNVWQELRAGRADPTEYQAHVLECVAAAKADGLFYNSEVWPRAAVLMADRFGYPDARSAGADNGVASEFGTHCYCAGDVLSIRHKAELNRTAAAGFRAGQVFPRLIFNDGKNVTGARLSSMSHTGESCKLTGKRGRYSVEFECEAYSLQCAIERAAERAGILAKRRGDAKPRAPIAPAPVPGDTKAEPVPADTLPADTASTSVDVFADGFGFYWYELRDGSKWTGRPSFEAAAAELAGMGMQARAAGLNPPVPADTGPDDDTTPAPLDGLDVIETADAETLAEFDRLSRAPGVAPPATDARPIPSGPVLRIPAGDLRARIPARFAPAYLLTA